MKSRTSLGAALLTVSLVAACAGQGQTQATPATPGAPTGSPVMSPPAVSPSATGSAAGSGLAASPTAAPSTEGTITFLAGDAGAVTVSADDDRVTLVSIDTNEGWTSRDDADDDGDEDDVEVDFENADGSVTVDFDAEIEDDAIDVEVDTDEPVREGTLVIAVAEAGSATIRIAGDSVALESVDESEGWTSRVDDDDDDDGNAEVTFVNEALQSTVELDAEIDDGRLEISIDSRVGAGHGGQDRDDDADDSDDNG